MNTPLRDILTIIIPSKNESRTIYDCVYNLAKQNNIAGIRVIIADISDEDDSIRYIRKVQTDFRHSLNIEVIKGGFPAQGRSYGAKKAETPYILFLDADIFLTNPNIITECLKHKKDLVTAPFTTDKPYRWVFRCFDIFQRLSHLMGTPFAVGGFQLFSTAAYRNLGGYNEKELFAEDYSLSSKINPKKFKILNIKGIYTSSRRFKNKGVLWMFYIIIKSYINRNNPSFFTKSHGYWD